MKRLATLLLVAALAAPMLYPVIPQVNNSFGKTIQAEGPMPPFPQLGDGGGRGWMIAEGPMPPFPGGGALLAEGGPMLPFSPLGGGVLA